MRSRILNRTVSALLLREFDALVISSSTFGWLLFIYTPLLLSWIMGRDEYAWRSAFFFAWIPSVLAAAVFMRAPSAVSLKTVGALLVFMMVGGVSYTVHVLIVGFSIIDMSWFGFYVGSIAFILASRRRQRYLLRILTKAQNGTLDLTHAQKVELLSEWRQSPSYLVRAMLAGVTVMGVCMSILFSTTSTNESGLEIPGWSDWLRVTNAARMIALFLVVCGNSVLCFVGPSFAYVPVLQQHLFDEPPADRQRA